VVIGTEYTAQVLWIELGRQGRGADEVAEHHGELTAFGGVLWSCFGYGGRMRCDRGITGKLPDRAEHLAAITEQDAQLLQVMVCQIGENAEINTVLCETLRVLGHAEIFKPVGNLLHGRHRQF
jgi:hypothetical protein